MPVAYIIGTRDKLILAPLREKADPVIVFENRPVLGPWFAERNTTVLSLDPKNGEVVFKTPPPPLYRPRRYDIANYLLWRKFMLRYHFIEKFYNDRYTNRFSSENFELRYMRHIVENNTEQKKALELMDELEDKIFEGALTMANRYKELGERDEERLRLMLRMVRAMHYSWFASQGIDERLSSLYQLPALYVAMKYALDFGFDSRDFVRGRITDRALKIMVRLFNEKVVHAPVNPGQHRKNLQKWFEGLYKKEVDQSDYLFGRSLCS